MRRIHTLLSLAVAALLSLELFRSRPSAARDEITLGVASLRISLPLFLAAEQRIFARHGLRVRLRPYPTAQPMIDDVALGRLDAGGFAAWPIILLTSARSGVSLEVTAGVLEDEGHRLSYVLARRGSGLRFPRDAAGRRVGVLPTVAYRRWLSAMLVAARVDPGSVETVSVEPGMQAQTLARGGVDMLFTSDPMATAMLARGVAELIDDGPPCARRIAAPFHFGAVALSGDFVRRAPARARALSRAIDDAVLAARRDPSAARASMRRYLRPDERPWIDRYPPSRHATASESAEVLWAEIERERAMGILDRTPFVRPLGHAP